MQQFIVHMVIPCTQLKVSAQIRLFLVFHITTRHSSLLELVQMLELSADPNCLL